MKRPQSARADVRSAAVALTERGQRFFSPAELIAELRQRGSTYPDTTLRTHIVSLMCVNTCSPSAGTYPDLVRVARGLYRLADASDTVDRRLTATTRHPPKTTRAARAHKHVEALVAEFGAYLAAFEAGEVFEGPSLYFHVKAIERRRAAPSATALLRDLRFLEYVYAVLPSWGMHRMGKQAAKVPDFETFAGALRACEPQIEQLWHLDITSIHETAADDVGLQLWDIIATLRSSTSNARLVSGSKTLHHALPDLIPPIDREYTFRFFTGQTLVWNGERESFLAWWPGLCDIGRRCARDIRRAVGRPEVMATSPSKVIDNAIVGFRLRQRLNDE